MIYHISNNSLIKNFIDEIYKQKNDKNNKKLKILNRIQY